MKGSPLLPIFLIVLVDILGLTIILPLLPFYAEHLGASADRGRHADLVLRLLPVDRGAHSGPAFRSHGRKPLLIVSQIGTLVGFLILAFSNQLWLVFLSRIIDGHRRNLSLAQAYIADVTSRKTAPTPSASSASPSASAS